MFFFFYFLENIYGGNSTAEYRQGQGDRLTEGRTPQALPYVACDAQDQARPSRQHQGGGHFSTEECRWPVTEENSTDSAPLKNTAYQQQQHFLFFLFILDL